MFLILLGIYLGVELLGHMVTLCLILLGIAKLFSTAAEYFILVCIFKIIKTTRNRTWPTIVILSSINIYGAPTMCQKHRKIVVNNRKLGFMCVYAYVCAYVYVCMCICMCVYVCVYACVCICVYVFMYVYVCVYECVCLCVCVYMNMCVYVCVYMNMCVYVCVFMYMYVFI